MVFPTAYYQIEANRYAPHSDYVDVNGYDFTGATFEMEVRDQPNGGTVRATVTPTVSVTTDGGVPRSRVSWSISRATMEAMPLDPSDPAKDNPLRYDLKITPSDGDEFVAWGGPFIVKAGVTQ